MTDETPGGGEPRVLQLEGRVLGDRFRVENVVSSGANTVITEAVDTAAGGLGDPVTLKIVRPELAASPEFRRAFRRQVEVAMSLSHPNIADVVGWGDVVVGGDTTVFWAVEYLDGGSLRDLLDRGRLIEPSQALVVGLEACRALGAAHAQQVMHTEVTPSKLVFGADGRLRIVDFALARLLGATAWAEPATVATHVARYASPEQALGLPVDPTTDVYALALCLIEAMTGKVPFAGDSTVSTLAARVGKLMPVTADMGSLASVLERAGRPEADDRWSADEFGDALVQAAGKLPRPSPIPVLTGSLFAASLAAPAPAPTPSPSPAPTPGRLDVDPSEQEPSEQEPSEQEPSDDAPSEDTGPEDAEPVEQAPSDDAADERAEPEDGEQREDGEQSAAAPVDEERHDESDDESDGGGVGAVGPVAGAAVGVGVATVASGAADAADEPLIVLTDVADPPTGAVQVGEGSSSGADAGPGTSVSPPASTAEMPATLASDAAAATAVAAAPVDGTPSAGIYDDEAASRPWGRYLAFALVIVLGIAALGYAGWLLLRTESFEVPDLVGVEESIALNEVAGNGWVIETDRERSDDVPEVDHVVRSVPAAGTMLDEGETFTLVVSEGPELRTLPELDDMTVADATAELESLLLVALPGDAEFSEDVPLDSVIRWQVQDDASLVAGAQVLPGTVIEITPSLGPEPRPAPDLTEVTVDEATSTLDGLQLVLERGDDVFSNTVETGRVVSQQPAPGTPVERGGTVTVQVSKGPDLVPIPDLTGLAFPAAETALLDAGFVIDRLLGTTEGTFVSISVDGDEVAAGDQFLRGTGVELIFL